MTTQTINNNSHSFQLGVCQYERDKYQRALELIIIKADALEKHSRNFGGARDDGATGEAEGAEKCAAIARDALGVSS